MNDDDYDCFLLDFLIIFFRLNEKCSSPLPEGLCALVLFKAYPGTRAANDLELKALYASVIFYVILSVKQKNQINKNMSTLVSELINPASYTGPDRQN